MIQINDAKRGNFTEVLVYTVKANLKGNNIFVLFSSIVFHCSRLLQARLFA